MPIKPRNPNNIRSVELNASHKDHAHAHSDITGQTADDHHAEAHTVASHSDTTATGAELETLTDGSNADALHAHVPASHNHVEADVTDLDHPHELTDMSDVNTSTPTNRNVLVADGVDFESRALVEADISDLDHDDTDAIHDNVSGEINAITEKASPVSGDLLLIEDSAASNAKKKVQVGNLPGGTSDHGALTGLTDDDHTQYLLRSDMAVDTYTPVLTASVSNPNLGLGNGGSITGTFIEHEGLIFYWVIIKFGSSGVSGGDGRYDITLPVAADDNIHTASSATFGGSMIGSGGCRDDSAVGNSRGFLVQLRADAASVSLPGGQSGFAGFLNNTTPFTFAANDSIVFSGQYIAA